MVRTLAEFAATITENPGFSPKPWFNPDGDCVQLYIKNDESYRDRVDDKLTLYRSIVRDEIVGCQIKGVRGMLRRLGGVVVFKHKELPFALLIIMSHYEGTASPYEPLKRRKRYDAILNKTEGSQVEFTDNWCDTIETNDREPVELR